ncbi:nitrite reductase [NAD(P)H] large subunit [Photobacterium aphoticum]|uniref:Nitrite reductase [NAD(P)H] large subunit n=1 Tax=Photobacterium aphoticum TaxID=754436 RepID=A0A090QR48_9GAMM|nr:nitrite reductase [NAD(P)H] large subunit [Photobacterium aphoticum]
MQKQRIVVVGNGMVGHKFIQDMLAHSALFSASLEHASQAGAQRFELVTFTDEPRLAYDRVQLSQYFSGKTLMIWPWPTARPISSKG